MRRLPRLPLLLAAALVAIPAAVALAAAPSVTTTPATNITTGGATLNASVDPNGEPTTVHWQWGTTTAYDHTTGPVDAGSGSSPVNRSINITGLTAGVTYHYRAVATNGSSPSGVNGPDQTFTAGNRPGVATDTATGTPTGGTIRGRVDPNGLATSYRFQYGTSSSNLNRATETQSAGAGNNAVAVSAQITGMSANTRVYYRVAATNARGTVNGSTRSFVTGKSLSINELSIPRSRYGGSALIGGDLDGSGVSGTRVTVSGTPFPFSAPFATLGSASANRDGRFAIRVWNIQANTRIRISAAGNTTTTLNLYNGPRVGVILRRGSRLRFRGTVTPAAPNGIVRIQKRKSNGRWGNVRRGKLRPFTNGRSRYSLSARRSKGLYRVIVVPRDGGAHSAGYSRRVRVR